MEGSRPGLDQYFMDMTHLIKSRGTCPRRQVGALIVKEKRVLTTGYNGAPRNFPHPTSTGCIRDELEIPSGLMADVCPCLHAEQNALLQAATTGVSIEGADLYCTTQPCTQCSRMIANCGIRRVVFEQEYADPLSIGLLVTAGIELWKWDPDKQGAHPYGNQNTWSEAQDELRRRWKEGDVAPSDRPIADASEAEAASEAKSALSPAHPTTVADLADAPTWQRPERARLAPEPDAPDVKAEQAAAGPPDGEEADPVEEGSPEDEADDGAPKENGKEVHVEGVRGVEGDPKALEIMRRMIEEREDRLQRALDEARE